MLRTLLDCAERAERASIAAHDAMRAARIRLAWARRAASEADALGALACAGFAASWARLATAHAREAFEASRAADAAVRGRDVYADAEASDALLRSGDAARAAHSAGALARQHAADAREVADAEADAEKARLGAFADSRRGLAAAEALEARGAFLAACAALRALAEAPSAPTGAERSAAALASDRARTLLGALRGAVLGGGR